MKARGVVGLESRVLSFEARLESLERHLNGLWQEPGVQPGAEAGAPSSALQRLDHRLERLALLNEDLERRFAKLERRQLEQSNQIETRIHRQEARLEDNATDLEKKIARARELLSHRIDNERRQMVDHIQETLDLLGARATEQLETRVTDVAIELGQTTTKRLAAIDARIDDETGVLDRRFSAVDEQMSEIRSSIAALGDRLTSFRRLALARGDDGSAPEGVPDQLAARLADVEARLDGLVMLPVVDDVHRVSGNGGRPSRGPVVETVATEVFASSSGDDAMGPRLIRVERVVADLVRRIGGTVRTRPDGTPIGEPLDSRLRAVEAEVGAVARGLRAVTRSSADRIDHAISEWEARMEQLRAVIDQRVEDDRVLLESRLAASAAESSEVRELLAAVGRRLDQPLARSDEPVAELRNYVDSRMTGDRDAIKAELVVLDSAVVDLRRALSSLTERVEHLTVATESRVADLRAAIDERLDADQTITVSMLGGLEHDIEQLVEERFEGARAVLDRSVSDLRTSVDARLDEEHASLFSRLGKLEASADDLRKAQGAPQRQPDSSRDAAAGRTNGDAPARAPGARSKETQAQRGPSTAPPRKQQPPKPRPADAAPSSRPPAPSPVSPSQGPKRNGTPTASGREHGPNGTGDERVAVMLRRGTRGARVRAVQQLLVTLGYEPGAVDGNFGPRTAEAVSRFQTDARAAGLFPHRSDGIWSPKTAAAASALAESGSVGATKTTE